MQAYCILIASNFVTRQQMLSVIYFYDQFVAPKIRHSRRHCIVCQQSSLVYSMCAVLLYFISLILFFDSASGRTIKID